MSGAQTPPDAAALALATYENTIPRAVREQAARAEAIARGIGMRNAGEGEALAPTIVLRMPGGDPNAALTVAEGEIAVPPAAPPTQAPLPPATQSPPPPAAQAPPPPATTVVTPPATTVGDWEAQFRQMQQRFNTLQGKYSAETPQLHAQLRDARAEIERLNNELAASASNGGPKPGAVPQEDLDAYGADLVDKARSWARAEMAPELQQLQQQLNSLQKTTDTTSKDLTINGVRSTLDVLVPNWKTIDFDPGFMAWLNQNDPFSGQPRMSLFGAARDSGDGARVAAFYTRYSAEQTAPQPGFEPQQGHTPAPARAPLLPLEALAAPGLVRPTGNGAPPEQRAFTRNEISAFYADVSKGKWASNEAGKARLEAQIHAAMAAGRIR